MNNNKEASGLTKIHNVRFYNLTPRSIQSMAYNDVWQKLALSRKDGSIEIWDVQHAPFLEKVVPKSPGNSVEGMAWTGERLFSVGLTGELVEWDLQLLHPLRKQFATGNSIWCIDINPLGTELAIGTEEGYINLFDIEGQQMQYKTVFDKQEGRVLCCKFNSTGDMLVTGSLGAIRIWDVRSGHALHKMSLARSEKKKEVIVWSLEVLSDFTIISGDSRGQLVVWDGRMATQLEAHKVLGADVLSVAVNKEENLLVCSGIDPIIRIYAKTKINRDDSVYHCWVKYLQRDVHDHDVKALVCAGDRIFSGGMDGNLGISSLLRQKLNIEKYVPFMQNPCVAVAAGSRLLLLRYTNYFEVWRLGSTAGKPDLLTRSDSDQKNSEERKLLTLDTEPEKLLEIKSKHGEPLVCATISPNGKWLCYSTLQEIRLFRFVPALVGKHATQLAHIKDLPEQFKSASHILFSSDSKRLFLVQSATKEILIFSIVDSGSTDLDFIESIETGKHIKEVINLFAISNCGTYIVAAGTDHTIAVWSVFKGKHFKHRLNMPRYSAVTTAIAIHPELPRVVATFSDGKVIEYDLEDMCFTCSEHVFFEENGGTHCVSNILLDKRNANVIVLHNDVFMYVLEKCAPNAATSEDEIEANMDEGSAPASKKSSKKSKLLINNNKVCGLRVRFQRSFEHLISLCWLSADELVAVGVNPISILEQLPPVYKQKKFGSL